MVKLKSRHYNKRFPEWRDPPTACDTCSEPLVVLALNKVVYGANVGVWPVIYLCMSCGAFCGCHPHSVYPLGSMADGPTRARRRALHAAIDPLWKDGGWPRSEVYGLMAGLMALAPGRRFHIGELSFDECAKANDVFRAWETAADFAQDL